MENRPNLDKEYLKKLKPDLVKTLTITFFKNSPVMIRKIEECLKANDLDGAEMEIHKFGGAGAVLGGKYLKHICIEWETKIKTNSEEENQKNFKKMTKAFNDLGEELSNYAGVNFVF